jgi:AAA family ATP:ADP antiporter
MSPPQRDSAMSSVLACLAAGAMIAHQVGSKAVRDAFFLSNFDVTALPGMLVAAALTSIVFVLAIARLLTVWGPGRLVPTLFGISALLLILQWLLAGSAPRISAILVFLHVAALGPVLISGFWSFLTERFNPYAARQWFGRVGTAGAFGGLVGGILVERVAAASSVSGTLPVLAGLHIFCAWALASFVRTGAASAAPAAATPVETGVETGEEIEIPSADLRSGVRTLFSSAFLRDIAALVFVGAAGAALLDYVFKAHAASAFLRDEDKIRLFSGFYTGTALLTFLLQVRLSGWMLKKRGLGPTLLVLPSALAAGAMGVLVIPGLVAAAIGRAGEAIVRNSLFRSGYEVLFTPLRDQDRRSTKALVDVGFDRLGDAVGGGLVLLLLLLGAGNDTIAMLVVALALGILAIGLTLRVQRGYVRTVIDAVERGVKQFAPGTVTDRTTELTLSSLVIQWPKPQPAQPGKESPPTPYVFPVIPRPQAPTEAAPPVPAPARAPSPASDRLVARIEDLRSNDTARIRRVLAEEAPLDPALATFVIPLLVRDDLRNEVIQALRASAPRITGQLVDHLLDPTRPDTVRRRIPRVLAVCTSGRAVEGLLLGLDDKHFDVRYQCGRILGRLRDRNPDLAFDAERILATAAREVSVERAVWEGRQMMADRLDKEDAAEENPLDAFVRQRANRSLEHVFTILSLTLPRRALLMSFRALQTTDENVRQTALEYLEGAIPDPIRSSLWPFLEDRRKVRRSTDTREQILARLEGAYTSIEINLAELRKRMPGGAAES